MLIKGSRADSKLQWSGGKVRADYSSNKNSPNQKDRK